MKHEIIQTLSAGALEQLPAQCGKVTIHSSDVAGIVQSVIGSSARLRNDHRALMETVDSLDMDQHQVVSASDEARLLSARARERLGEGTDLIRSSLDHIEGLLALVEALGEHVTGFASAMNQVKRSAQTIDNIARTTNMLALNAAIEAEKAGEAGATFAVVANEVKELARGTRSATDEINRTIESLGGEAAQVIAKIEHGTKSSGDVQQAIGRIDETLTGVTDLVLQVDLQNDDIVQATGKISGHIKQVRGVLKTFDATAEANNNKLAGAHGKVTDLEMTANGMFDIIVKAGLSPDDAQMVTVAQDGAALAVKLAEHALASGMLTRGQLFDTNYQKIEGSNPARFRTGLSDWAHAHWRPLLDKISAQDSQIMASACTDRNGFLPTHLTERSRQPNGDLAHDTEFCRDGRIIYLPMDVKAKASTHDYTMAVYRQEGDGKDYVIVRNVYVPLIIDGTRWGDFEVAYAFKTDDARLLLPGAA